MDADAKTSSNPSDDEATVASLLRGYRLAAGLSQAELAERASISVAAIASLEQGLRKSPHQFTLNNIADALDLTRAERTKFEEARTRAHARRVQAQQVALDSNLPDELLLNNLPPELTSFVDRENDVPEIKLLLQSHRLVTVIGAGGAGKTRCALRVAGEMLDDFVDGTWFVELAHTSDPALVATTVAKALKLQEVPNRSALETLLAYLKRKHSLLFLDNCEHVITEVGHLVACALRDCPHVRILATSRESFAIAGERAYRLPSLPVPNVSELESLQQLLQYGSVRLFGDRAASADDRFTLTMETAPHVAYICRRLDGIPLAIELAAARVNVLSARTLARKLDERFLMLTGGDRNALPR
ncbi:MAG: helix-turn-helix domain-containing protein, partial [Candidatus Eremiobacteraeota bacterium]|nr:helix-turn-helix domain-containing protein [Candidatus Eremiobacteraeota bacterium]